MKRLTSVVAVEDRERAVLQIGPDVARIDRIGNGPHAVAADDVDPMPIENAFAVERVLRAAEAAVVLKRGADAIGVLVGEADVIDLSDRQIPRERPVREVGRQRVAAVFADDDPLGVRRDRSKSHGSRRARPWRSR